MRMRGGGSRRSECAARGKRAHHEMLARLQICAVDVGTVETLPDRRDCEQREMIGERVLADEYVLQASDRRWRACHRSEGLDGVRERVAAGACRQRRRATQRQLGIAHGDLTE